MEMELIIKGVLIGWFIAHFQPLQDFITKHIKPKIKNSYIYGALSCFKCLSFYSILFIGAFYGVFLPFEAILGAMIAFTYDKIINSFKTQF